MKLNEIISIVEIAQSESVGKLVTFFQYSHQLTWAHPS